MLSFPGNQPLPADLGQLPGRGDARDLRAGALADPLVEVRECDVLLHELHRCFDEQPSQPGRTLLRDVTVVAMLTRLVYPSRESRIRSYLFRSSEPRHVAQLADNHHGGVESDAAKLRERIDLWVQWPQTFKPFVDCVDLQLVMAEPGDEFIADDVVYQSELLLGEPAQASWTPWVLEDRLHVVPCEQCSQ